MFYFDDETTQELFAIRDDYLFVTVDWSKRIGDDSSAPTLADFYHELCTEIARRIL